MEIILARHGKPKLKHWAWITPRQMKDWIQLYNQAELLVEDVPLDTLKKATESGVIIFDQSSSGIKNGNSLPATKGRGKNKFRL